MALMQRFMRLVAGSGILPDARLLEWYPPFRPMRIKVLEISEEWRRVRIRLPLNAMSRNPGGVMFGGYQAALADPIAALACARVFPWLFRLDPRHERVLRPWREFRPRDAVFSDARAGAGH
jgi:hypothetical protein